MILFLRSPLFACNDLIEMDWLGVICYSNSLLYNTTVIKNTVNLKDLLDIPFKKWVIILVRVTKNKKLESWKAGMPLLTDVIGHFSVWEKSLYTCSNSEVSKCARVIQQGNRNLVKLFRYLKVRVIIIQKQMIHYISLCVFTWCTCNTHHHSRSFKCYGRLENLFQCYYQ